MSREEGLLTLKSRWKDYSGALKEETTFQEAYAAVEANTTGTRPKEIFDDLVEELELEYEKDKVGRITLKLVL